MTNATAPDNDQTDGGANESGMEEKQPDEEEVEEQSVSGTAGAVLHSPTKKRELIDTKQTSHHQNAPKTRHPGVSTHARLQRHIVEERHIRIEELQIKQSEQDQKLAEEIAAKFEMNTDELRLKRLQDRLDLIQKLDQKRIRVVSDEAKVDEQPLKSAGAATVVTKGEEENSDSEDDDFELDIIVKKPSSSVGRTAKSSAMSMLDMVGGLDSSDKKQKPWAPSGKGMAARAALHNELQSRRRQGANMWLARELGYQTQEEHIRDCMLVVQKKRKNVIKTEIERLRVNERKQHRADGMLMEREPHQTKQNEYNPNEAEASTCGMDNGCNESEEEIATAREIDEEEEQDKEDGLMVISGHGVDSLDERVLSVPSLDLHSPSFDTDTSSVERKETLQDSAAEVNGGTIDEKESVFQDTSAEIESRRSRNRNRRSCKQHFEPFVANQYSVPTSDETNYGQGSEVKEGSPPNTVRKISLLKEKNAGWKATLKKEAEKLKDEKKNAANHGTECLVESEAGVEEEKEISGLEGFGFLLGTKQKEDDEAEVSDADEPTDEDLKHIVDDISDDEGDEEAGEIARKELEQKEDKQRHMEILRHVCDGYDGRRGGITASGVGARGVFRFDQLVAADNREDARHLGLLNDDELDSEATEGDKNLEENDEDENALVDKMIKARYLHGSSLNEVEETFSSDEAEEKEDHEHKGRQVDGEDHAEQERLTKQFTRRARMQRLIENHGEDEEFSQVRLIDEDETMRLDLKMIKSVPRRSISESYESVLVSRVAAKTATLLPLGVRIAKKKKTSFLGGPSAFKEISPCVIKGVTMGHVIFNTSSNQSFLLGSQPKRKRERSSIQEKCSTSFWDKVSENRFKKIKRDTASC